MSAAARIPIRKPARLKIAGKNPADLLVLGNPKLKRRANPAELLVFGNPKKKAGALSVNPAGGQSASETLYEEFHQARPGEFGERPILSLDEAQDMPRHTAVLGDLVALGLDTRANDGRDLHGDGLAQEWKKCSHISLAGCDVKLAADPHGGQLYFVGGDQALTPAELERLGATRGVDGMLIGPAAFIVYDARKMMNGGAFDGYCHEFGEEGGRRPSIYYDSRIQRLLLRGGSYTVEDVGIKN